MLGFNGTYKFHCFIKDILNFFVFWTFLIETSVFHPLQVQRKEESNYWYDVVLCGATASVPPEVPVLLTIAFAISVQTQYSEKSK